MLDMNSAKFINFVSILQSPSSVVPSLSDSEVYTIIVDSIKAYVNQDISIRILVDIASKIRLFSGIKENASEEINEALIMLTDLSRYLDSPKKNKDAIDKALIETLDILSK